MTEPWQLYVTWGLLVGVGASAGAVGMASAVANRWFVTHRGLAMGLLTSAQRGGQLIFLPMLGRLSQDYGWRSVSITVTLAIVVLIPIVAILLPESPAAVGLGPLACRGRAARTATQRQSVPYCDRRADPRRALDGFLAAAPSASGFAASPPTA